MGCNCWFWQESKMQAERSDGPSTFRRMQRLSKPRLRCEHALTQPALKKHLQLPQAPGSPYSSNWTLMLEVT